MFRTTQLVISKARFVWLRTYTSEEMACLLIHSAFVLEYLLCARPSAILSASALFGACNRPGSVLNVFIS